MRVIVRKCPFTGLLFEEKDIKDYILHLQRIRAQHREEWVNKRFKEKHEAWLVEKKKQIFEPKDLEKFLVENLSYLIKHHNKKRKLSFGYDSGISVKAQIATVSVTSRFNPQSSNTHACPRNGVTNWGGQKLDAPRGYPGYDCHITVSAPGLSNLTSILDSIDVRIGSGSGNSDRGYWSYSITMFEDDFPNMIQTRTANKLKG